MNKRVAMLLTVLLGLAVFLPLAAEEAQPVALNVLKDFSSATRDGAVVIGVTGTYPILDFTYYDYDPETFVVDLADVDASQIPKVLSVNSGAVSTVKVEAISRAKGRSLTKLEVRKAYLAKCLVSTEGNRLVVRVIGAGEAPPAATPAPTVAAPAPEPRAEAKPAPVPATAVAESKPARTLTGVQVAEGGSEVRLMADGTAQVKSFSLPNPARVVLDLPGVGRGSVPARTAGQGNIQQVRVSLFQADPLITRVVLDLAEGQKDWRVSTEGDAVVVRFGAPAEVAKSPEPPAPTAPAAPAPEVAQSDAAPAAQPAPATDQVKVNLAPLDPAAGKEFKGYEDLFVAQDTSAPTPDTKTIVAGGVPLSFKEKTISGGQTKYSGEPISLSLKDADVKDVLRVFHDLSKMNIVVHPAVSGKVTVDLENVPWDQAMDIILKNNNLDYVYENSVIWVAPSSEISRKFSEQQKMQDERLKAEETVTFTKRLSYAKAETMKGIANTFLSPKGQIFVDARTNTMIIQEVPSQKDGLVKLIDTLDTATPQVLIEARIVETSVSWNQQFGIQWSGNWFTSGPAAGPVTWENGSPGGSYTAQQFGNTGWPNYGSGDFAVNMLPTASNGFIDLMLGNISGSFMLDVKLAAMEDTGRGRVLSAPRVLTQDNEKASIESGRQIPIQVATSDKITVVFVNATLKLEVLPQISADGNVNMTVDITNDSIDFKNALPTGPPPIIKKEAKTVLKVRDGQTQVIGGIFVTNEGVSQKGLPFFSKIPVLGWLFKNRNKTRQNDELLIFLTPKIVR